MYVSPFILSRSRYFHKLEKKASSDPRLLNILPNLVHADIIHYTVAIAAINDIDLTKTIFEKDKKAAIKYQHERDLEGYLEAEGQN